MTGIADTGFLVAFANRADRHHEWAVAVAAQVTRPLLTCEAVLAAAAFHLGDTALVLAMVREGLVSPVFDLARHLDAIASRCADRAPDLADLCLVRLSELHPRLPVFTTDTRDFRVCRRNRRDRPDPFVGRSRRGQAS